jgi:hypothetical protein
VSTLSVAFSGTPAETREQQKPPPARGIGTTATKTSNDYRSTSPLYDEALIAKEDMELFARAYQWCRVHGEPFDQLNRRALRQYLDNG